MNVGRTATHALISRLIRGIGASALGPIVTSAIQLGSVPLLLHAWGVAKYGDWLLLSAIPSYLTFSGLGFGDSSGSEMTMSVAGRDRAGALATFQSSWVLLQACRWALWPQSPPSFGGSPGSRPFIWSALLTSRRLGIILALAGWILAVQQSNLLESGYRCDGNFALGNLWSSVQRLVEATAGTIVGVVTGSLLAVSLSYLGFGWRGWCAIGCF